MQLVLARTGPIRRRIRCKRTHFSYRESHCPSRRRDGPLSPGRRCGENIDDKRIYNLHTSIQDGELRNDFNCRLTYLRLIPKPSLAVRTRFLGLWR
jgi:hypothetical protein